MIELAIGAVVVYFLVNKSPTTQQQQQSSSSSSSSSSNPLSSITGFIQSIGQDLTGLFGGGGDSGSVPEGVATNELN